LLRAKEWRSEAKVESREVTPTEPAAADKRILLTSTFTERSTFSYLLSDAFTSWRKGMVETLSKSKGLHHFFLSKHSLSLKARLTERRVLA